MADISIISGDVRTTLIALSRAQESQALSARRIASGLRVASPLDGVAAFFDASALSSRAARLLAVKDRIASAAVVTGGTISAIDSIVELVNSLKAAANKANGVSTTATGNTITTASADITDTIAGAVDGDTFTVTHNGTTTTITNTAGSTFTSLAAQITAISGLTATVSNGKNLEIQAVDGLDITVAKGTGDLATDLGLSTSTNGTFITSAVRGTAETNFDALRDQISALTGGATFNGTNFLSTTPDSLTVLFGDGNTNKLTISGAASNATALSISAVDTAGSFATNAGVAAAIAQLDAALVTLGKTRERIVTSDKIIEIRLDFVENVISLTNSGVENLTGADIDAETAVLLALQTRNDLAVDGISTLFRRDSAIVELLKTD